MAYIERETYSKALKDLISDSDGRTNYEKGYIKGLATANGILLDENQTPTADVVEVVRCKDCIHAIELDKHCDINRTEYKHCTLLRGDETKYVWHKYKKYYKDYSIVEPNDYCSYGERKDGE